MPVHSHHDDHGPNTPPQTPPFMERRKSGVIDVSNDLVYVFSGTYLSRNTSPARQLAEMKNSCATNVHSTMIVSHRSCGFVEQPMRPNRNSLNERKTLRTLWPMPLTKEELRVEWSGDGCLSLGAGS